MRDKLTVTRMPDGCRQVGQKTLIRVKTPWDWILTHDGITAFIDTKTVFDKTFAHSNIQEHQVVEMIKHEMDGAIGGYVIWLRKTNEVLFVPSLSLVQMMQCRGSISRKTKDTIYLGQVERFNPIFIWKADGKSEITTS